ncbi:hypothetical protein OIV83_002762 [Microbotryomycetes sp. JL201]|nr:hypothetical protein OIV83_002762 [Microbotryomycetes sp. JL201]
MSSPEPPDLPPPLPRLPRSLSDMSSSPDLSDHTPDPPLADWRGASSKTGTNGINIAIERTITRKPAPTLNESRSPQQGLSVKSGQTSSRRSSSPNVSHVGLQSASEYAFSASQKRGFDNVGLGIARLDQLPSPPATVSEDSGSASGTIKLPNGFAMPASQVHMEARSPDSNKPARPPKSEARAGLLTPTKSALSPENSRSPMFSDVPVESDIASMSMHRDESSPSPELIRMSSPTLSKPSVSGPQSTKTERRRTLDLHMLSDRRMNGSPSPSKVSSDMDRGAASPTHSRTASDFTPRSNRTVRTGGHLGSLREDATFNISPSRSLRDPVQERSSTSMSNYGSTRAPYVRRSEIVGSERTRAASALGDYADQTRPLSVRSPGTEQLVSQSPRVRRRTSVSELLDKATDLPGSPVGTVATSSLSRRRPGLPSDFRQSPRGATTSSKSLETRADEILASRRRTLESGTPVRTPRSDGRSDAYRDDPRDLFRDSPSRLSRYRSSDLDTLGSSERNRDVHGGPVADSADRSFESIRLDRRSSIVRGGSRASPVPASPSARLTSSEDRIRSSSRMSVRPNEGQDHHHLLDSAFEHFQKHFSKAAPSESTSGVELVRRMKALVQSTCRLNDGLHELGMQARLASASPDDDVLVRLEKGLTSLLRISNDQVRSLTEDLIAMTRLDRERAREWSGEDQPSRSVSRVGVNRSNVSASPLPMRSQAPLETVQLTPETTRTAAEKGSDTASVLTFNSGTSRQSLAESSGSAAGTDGRKKIGVAVASPKYGPPTALASDSLGAIGHSPLSRFVPLSQERGEEVVETADATLPNTNRRPNLTRLTSSSNHVETLASTDSPTRSTALSRRTSAAAMSDQTGTTSPRSFYSAFERYEARRSSSSVQTPEDGVGRGRESSVGLTAGTGAGAGVGATNGGACGNRLVSVPAYGPTYGPAYGSAGGGARRPGTGVDIGSMPSGATLMERQNSRASTASERSSAASFSSAASASADEQRAERLRAVGSILERASSRTMR